MSTVKISARQGGKSALGNLVFLLLLGFGVWVGIQYIPMKIKQGTMNQMLDQVQQRHNATPYVSDRDVWAIIDKQLNVNEMRDMRQYFTVTRDGNAYKVSVDYKDDLNLLFTSMNVEYKKTLDLR